MAAIVEAIRSDLKFSADLESGACRVAKIVQPCSLCLGSASCNGVCRVSTTSADAVRC